MRMPLTLGLQLRQRTRTKEDAALDGRAYALLEQHYVTLYRLQVPGWKKYVNGEAWCYTVVARHTGREGGKIRKAISQRVRHLRRVSRAAA